MRSDLLPDKRKDRRRIRVCRCQSVYSCVPVLIVIRFRLNQVIERIGDPPVPHNHYPNTAYTAPVFIGCFDINRCKIIHVPRTVSFGCPTATIQVHFFAKVVNAMYTDRRNITEVDDRKVNALNFSCLVRQDLKSLSLIVLIRKYPKIIVCCKTCFYLCALNSEEKRFLGILIGIRFFR